MAVISREPGLRVFHPIWPDRQEIDDRRVVCSYDRMSDTLHGHFYGRGRPAISVALDIGDQDDFYARVDPESDEVIGLQIEGFLGNVVHQHPALLDVMDLAELRGITPAEVADVRRDVALSTNRRNHVITLLFKELAVASQ